MTTGGERRPSGSQPRVDGGHYLSALIHLLGPVTAVTGAASTPRTEREIPTGPRAGQLFAVEVDTHVTGILHHTNGALSALLMSFDIHAADLPRIEVHGTEGSLSLPDPNTFDGPVRLWRAGSDNWQPLPGSAGHPHAGRRIGLADLAHALTTDRPTTPPPNSPSTSRT